MFYKWQKDKKPKLNYQCIIMMDQIVNTLQNTKKSFKTMLYFGMPKYIYESMANLIRLLKPRHDKFKILRIEILSQVYHKFQL
jgi:hypothetical protein